jgi:ABC-2 type transport system ATP-binding protein
MEELVKLSNAKCSYLDKEFNLTLKKGELIILKGKNGCGKTTLLKLIVGSIKMVSGERIVFGSKYSYLPDNLTYPKDITVYDFLAEIRKIKDENKEIDEIYTLKLPIFKKIGELSLGNKKKLGIIITLIGENKFLLFDEPLNGLDLASIKIFKSIIATKIKNGTGVIICLHKTKVFDHLSTRIYEII